MSKKRLIAGIIITCIAVAINIFAIVESSIGASDSGEQSSRFAQFILDIVKFFDPKTTLTLNTPGFQNFVRKFFGHFLLFGGSGLFTTLGVYLLIKDRLVFNHFIFLGASFVFGLGIAALTEIMQIFTPGRAGLVVDVFIDLAGYVLFGGIAFIITWAIFRKQSKKERLKEIEGE